jgi:Flp pilus assembly protein TadG
VRAPGPGRGDVARAKRQSGQATAELAVVLLFVAMLVLVLVQAALVVRDHVVVMHAARDAARMASTGTDASRIVDRVRSELPDADVEVSGGGEVGAKLTVEVRYRSHTDVPIVGPLLPDVDVRGATSMRAER